jgi:KDO2-lipid IV(A) lauroyltransferase
VVSDNGFNTSFVKKRANDYREKSYQHLCDMFLEMIKTLSISKEEMEKRFVCKI